MSEHDKQNLTAIINGEGDWFTARLIRVIIHADMSNRRRLALGFPDEVHAVNVYNFGQEKADEFKASLK
jgi:hypothetical protein